MTGSDQGVDYLYDPMHRISRSSREMCMWTNRPVEGALVNSHFPGAIAWPDGDLNPGLDQERRVKTRTGGLRISEMVGRFDRAIPYSKGQCETYNRSHKAFDG
jgi:hypothetical protein